MTAIKAEFQSMVDTFLRGYEWEISRAQVKLGDMFHRDEYPTTASLVSKFAFRLSYIPLPDAGDFRIDVGNDAITDIKNLYHDYYSRQLSNAMNDVWSRAYDALSKMSERLDYADHEQKKVFRDTLVSNVIDIVELLDVCNVTGDGQMTAMRNRLEETMRGVTPEALREDEYLRTETKRAVDDVIKALPSIEL